MSRNNLTAVVGADTTGLEKSINQAKATLEKFSKEAKKASNSIKEQTGASNEQVAAYKRSVRALEKVQSGSMEATKAEKALANQVKQLKDQWNSLNDTAKRSDFGRSVSNSFSSAQVKLKQVRDEVAKTKEALRNSGDSVNAFNNTWGGLNTGLLKATSGIQSTGGALSALSATSKGFAATTGIATAGLHSMNVSSGLMATGLTAGTGALGMAATGAVKLGKNLIELADRAKEFDKITLSFKVNGLSDQEVDKLKQKIKEIADEFNMTKEQVVAVMNTVGNLAPQLKKNGDALAYVSKAAIQLANAALIPVDNAARALITVLTQMGVSVAESESIVTALAEAARNGTADIDYLQRAIGECGKQAANAGVSYTELISTIEHLAPSFSNPTEAGQKLAQIFEALGKQANDKFNPAVVGLDQALENLANAQLSTAKMAELVGDANVEMLKTMIEGRQHIKNFEDGLFNAAAAAEKAAENIEKTKGRYDGVKKAWEGFKDSLADTKVVGKVSNIYDKILAKIERGIEKTGNGLKKFLDYVYDGISFTTKAAVIGWKYAAKNGVGAMKTAWQNFIKYITSGKLGEATKTTFSAVKSGLNIMKEAILDFIKNGWNKLKETFLNSIIVRGWKNTVDFIKQGCHNIKQKIHDTIVNGWEKLKQKFLDSSIVVGFRATIKVIHEGLKAARDACINFIKQGWEKLKVAFLDSTPVQACKSACDSICDQIDRIGDHISKTAQKWQKFGEFLSKAGMWKDYLKAAGAAVVGDALGGKKGYPNSGRNNPKRTGSLVGDLMKSSNDMANKIQEEAPAVEEAVKDAVKEGLTEGAQEGAEEVKTAAQQAAENIQENINQAVDDAMDIDDIFNEFEVKMAGASKRAADKLKKDVEEGLDEGVDDALDIDEIQKKFDDIFKGADAEELEKTLKDAMDAGLDDEDIIKVFQEAAQRAKEAWEEIDKKAQEAGEDFDDALNFEKIEKEFDDILSGLKKKTEKPIEQGVEEGVKKGVENAGAEVKETVDDAIDDAVQSAVEDGTEDAKKEIKKDVEEAVEKGTEEGMKKGSTKFKKKEQSQSSGAAPTMGHPTQQADTSGAGKIKFQRLGADDYLKRLEEQAKARAEAEKKAAKAMEEAVGASSAESVVQGTKEVKKTTNEVKEAAKKGSEFAEQIKKKMEAAAKAVNESLGAKPKPVSEPGEIPSPDLSGGGSSIGGGGSRPRNRKRKGKPTGNPKGKGSAESTAGIDVGISQTGAELEGLGKGAEKAAESTAKLGGGLKGMLGNLKGVARAAGWVGATYMAVDALKDGAKTAMDFNQAMSTLQAVTGKSAGELEGLKQQALDLGATTRYSATEIASLQIELAKLGFDPTQIQDMTKNVQNLGTALSADLGSAASLTGATMRMFGLEAKDSQRIVDVMAASCSKSALDFSYLESAMSTVGPVANAFGLTLEDTIGLLGTLSNAGFDASSAATAARNIILNLADSNGDLAKTLGRTVTSGKDMLVALRDLKAGGIDLATALELTDKRSVAAFNTMMDGAESGYELMDALYHADGAAQQMSDTMSDNLAGDIAGMKSAWEGLMLQLMGGQDVVRLLVEEITDFIRILTENVKAVQEVYKEVEILEWTLKGLLTAWVFVWNAVLALLKTVVKASIGVLEGLYYALTFRFGKAKDAVVKNAKDIGQAWVDMAKKSIEQTEKIWKETPELQADAKIQATVSGNTMPEVQPITPPKKKKDKDKGGSGKEEKLYDEGSIGKLEQRISKLQDALKAAPTSALRLSIQREIRALEKQKEDIEFELRPELPEGSLAKINRDIQDQESLLELAVDDQSRKKIQDTIDKLTGQKEAIELKLKPVVEQKDLEALAESIQEHKIQVHANVIAEQTTVQRQTKGEKAQSQAGMLKEELDFHQQIVKAHKDEYQQIQAKIKAGGILNANEQELANVYEEAVKQVDRLTAAYDKASKAAMVLQTKSQFKKALYNGVKGTIDTLGGLNDSVSSVGNTWKNLAENWEDMTPFEQATQGISAVIGTIQEAMSAYESITELIQLFGDISAASSAKKVAADEAEMAMDTTKTATETANLGTKLANDAAENTSEIGKLGVKEAGAIASATSSGASLPFPANIAAIAAGIAAVVAAFAMVFSCFAEGGIVSGATHNGDYNLARVNSGEMILNGTQQKRLFNLLNGSGGINSSRTPNGQVDFKIRGKNLVGTLKNTSKRYSRI